MKVKAKLYIRNAALIEARAERGLSQPRTAELAGVSPGFLRRCENLDFPNIDTSDDVRLMKLCSFLNVNPNDVIPEELIGQRIQSKFESTAHVKPKHLLAFSDACKSRFLLPSPEKEVERDDEIALIKKFIDKLTYREREILKLYYGFDNGYEYTLEEIGRIFRVTTARAHQVHAKAIRKLQVIAEKQKMEL